MNTKNRIFSIHGSFRTIVLTLVLTGSLVAGAFSQSYFTLQDAIEAGLEHNHSIQIKTLDVQMAENLATPGNAGMLPNVGITGGLEQTYGSVNLTPGGFFMDLIGQQGGAQAPSKISYDGVSTTRVTAGIGAEMVLYGGLKGRTRYRLLRTGREAASLQLGHNIEQTILDITRSYVHAAMLQEALIVQQQALEQSRDRFRTVEEQRRYGQANEQQFLQALSDLKSDSVHYRDLDHRFGSAYRDLHQVIGWEETGRRSLESDFEVESDFELDHLLELASRDNRVLKLNLLETELSGYNLQLSRAAFYPTLVASAQYGYSYLAASEGQFEVQEQLGVSGGLTLRIPLFQGGGTSTVVQNARIEQRQKQIQTEQAERQIGIRIENTWSLFHHQKNQLETEQLNLSVYERNYERSHEAYRQGLVSGVELRNAQLALHSARLRITELNMQLKLTETTLLLLSGQLLEHD